MAQAQGSSDTTLTAIQWQLRNGNDMIAQRWIGMIWQLILIDWMKLAK